MRFAWREVALAHEISKFEIDRLASAFEHEESEKALAIRQPAAGVAARRAPVPERRRRSRPTVTS
jgi:hypothetical protein